ncbi:MAG TPA: 6-bladed beta-propeller, partial [Porphyromonadaceae bacterium]|nr:6-bladed beta-propeller [Porphyromonadaceae bacterium]
HFLGNVTIEKKLSENLSTTEYPAKFIVDKKTLKGAFYKMYNDFLGNMDMPWAGFNNGYYIWNVDPGELIDQLTQKLKEDKSISATERKRLNDMLNSMDENDNNYVFYGKLKQ